MIRFRLFLAQLIMIVSFQLLGCFVIHDYHWPSYLYVVNAVIAVSICFLIPRWEVYK